MLFISCVLFCRSQTVRISLTPRSQVKPSNYSTKYSTILHRGWLSWQFCWVSWCSPFHRWLMLVAKILTRCLTYGPNVKPTVQIIMVWLHSITLSSTTMATSAFAVFSNLRVAVQLTKRSKCRDDCEHNYDMGYHNNFVLLFMMLLVSHFWS